ncbi:MAG: glycosyltransferase family A protein [Candidatus Eisenbacteria bacterium]
MRPREQLTAIVLGDGARRAAADTALHARAHAGRVLIAERDAATAQALAEQAFTADVGVLACDWSDAVAAAELLATVDSEWAVFLAPGEALLTDDPAAFAREWRTLPAGPVELLTGARAETRLHPPSADALAVVGGPAPVRLRHLRIGPMPASIALPAPAAPESYEAATAGFAALAADLPAAIHSPRRLRGALRGDDLDALEHLVGALDLYEERRLLAMARDGRDVCWTDEAEAEPLVTIRIATYHRPELIGASIQSCLAQSYERIEVLVVGDHCSSETAAVVRGFRDSRVRFVNLPARGMYPSELMARWRVAGVLPANAALMLGEGSWITACDDDDEFTPDHVEVLLRAAREQRLEMVWSKADMEVAPGRWDVIGGTPLREGHVTQGSVLYSMGLRFLHLSNTCWRRELPADYHLWSRMQAIGVRMGFVDRVTYRHKLETHQRVRLSA